MERDLIPPQRDPNIARSPSGEVDDLKSNFISARFEMPFPKVVEFLRAAVRFFPSPLALIDIRRPSHDTRQPFSWNCSTPSPQGRAARRLRQGTQSQQSVKSVRLHGLNNFRNLIRTPRTLSVLVVTRLVGKNAHEQHAAAARRTSRTHKNSRRLTCDRRHTHTNKQTEARDLVNFD